MPEAVICSAVRTPVGSFGGAFREFSALDLGVAATHSALERAGLDPGSLDEVIFGSGGQPIEFSNIARQIALAAGVPKTVPAYSVQRNCASGAQAVAGAVMAIKAGEGDAFLVGGSENMSMAPYVLPAARWGMRLRHGKVLDPLWEGLTDHYTGEIMGLTAERLAERYGISREEQDRYALESHNKAFRAQRMGKFKDEIQPVSVPKRHGEPEIVAQDEGPQAGLSAQKLALYPTVFKEDGTVTPGNACPMSDAAAALVVMSRERAVAERVPILARIKAVAFAGCDPETMGLGPTASTPKALAKAGGMQIGDIDLIEFNEAFAAQIIACQRDMGFDFARCNVNGGGIALGHPIGATGVRLLVTLLHELRRSDKQFGLATMCVGGGQGASVVIENVR